MRQLLKRGGMPMAFVLAFGLAGTPSAPLADVVPSGGDALADFDCSLSGTPWNCVPYVNPPDPRCASTNSTTHTR